LTKREIIKYLEKKQEEKLKAVRADFEADSERAARQIHEEMGIFEMAGKIQPLLQQALDLWENWKARHESCDDLSTHSHFGSLPALLSYCTDGEEATYRKRLGESIRLKCPVLNNLSKEYTLQMERVVATFTTVLASVQRMKYVKEASAYLKELGFDLSELENPAGRAEKALMVPVDTNYLFVEAA
jgi:hypothetical protein